jgi:hypothetical protein
MKSIKAALTIGNIPLEFTYTSPSKDDSDDFIEKVISTTFKCQRRRKRPRFKSRQAAIIDADVIEIDAPKVVRISH